MTNEPLDEILAELRKQKAIDFALYRCEMVQSRVMERMMSLQCQDMEGYLERLRGDPAEGDALFDALAIKVSCFFRNPIVFEIMAQRIIPEILDRKRAHGSRELRIWSAGCAAGEEPYSVAILLREALEREEQPWDVHLFATDIDSAAIGQAQRGIYPEERLEDTKLGILRKYFHRQDDVFELTPEIRSMVSFSRDDLSSPKLLAPAESVFGTFDLILCRNVLIYLETEYQREVLKKVAASLDRSGWLVLGDSENLGSEQTDSFDVIDDRNCIYRKRE